MNLETASADNAGAAVSDARAERTWRIVSEAIEALRPQLKRDGGDCELVAVEGNTVSVRLTGACIRCQFSSATLGGVQERLIAALGFPVRVLPVPAF
jgi:NifU-like protein